MAGIRIAHMYARSAVVLVPVMSRPLLGQSIDMCPTCHQVHLVKTVHLTLDAEGTCIVSTGVLADLKSAGMPQLSILAEVLNPPPLQFIGAGVTRQMVDNVNRKIVRLAPPVHV